MVELYRGGTAVGVYPEGGRSTSNEMKPFSPDFARLVIKLRAPLVPVAIAGANAVLPIGSLLPRPNTPIAIAFGDPFELSGYYERPLDEAAAAEAARFIQERVAGLLVTARAAQQELAQNQS